MARRFTLIILLYGLVAACGGGDGASTTDTIPETIVFDCKNNQDCPEITINGDPWHRLPNNALSPMRGHADPSLRKDPNSSRLWLSYSYVGAHAVASGDPDKPIITPFVSIHLGHSDDSGQSWSFDKSTWESSLGTDQGFTSDTGYSIHEVSTITPLTIGDVTDWFALHLRYFLKQGDKIEQRKPTSFHHRLARVTSPLDFGNAAEAVLPNTMTAPGWGAGINLSQLAPELNDCDLWSEATLFQQGQKLYLLAECLVLDLTTIPATRRYDKEFNGVFVTDASGDINTFNWQWLGKLTTHDDALALGGNTLTQIDIARARDGKLIILVTPLLVESKHLGCRVLQVDSLDPPQLSRDADGGLIVRAEIQSSDADSSGLCAYDPNSETGVIFVRTKIDLSVPEVYWKLHATGVHP